MALENVVRDLLQDDAFFRLDQLCIEAGSHCWILRIDIIVSRRRRRARVAPADLWCGRSCTMAAT